MGKKELKKQVNEYGAFLQIPIEVMETNMLGAEYAAQLPENTFPFKGIASNGELNRNDYIIRESAWANALEGYMQNPIVLFQHQDDKALGNTISAKVTEAGLEVMGYIYRDLDEKHTGGAVQKNVYRSLSTGHITKDFEFENVTTGDVISKDEFRQMLEKQGWGEWQNDWKRAVTALEFVEWSIVAVGSNKAALRTNNTEREFLSRFYQIEPETVETNEAETEPETVQTETPVPVEAPVAEPVPVPEIAPVTEEVKEDNAVEPSAVEVASVPIVPPKEELDRMADALETQTLMMQSVARHAIEEEHKVITETLAASLGEVKASLDALAPTKETLDLQDRKITVIADAMVKLDNAFQALKKVVDSIPERKGLIAVSQQPHREEKKPVTNGIQDLFAKVGVKLS
jgi:hypothetical protein